MTRQTQRRRQASKDPKYLISFDIDELISTVISSTISAIIGALIANEIRKR